MARLLYGATAADVTATQTGQIIPGAVLEVWSAETGGTRVTDLLDASGTPTTVVTSDAYGRVRFRCPDGTTGTVWLQGVWGAGRMACKPSTTGYAAGFFVVENPAGQVSDLHLSAGGVNRWTFRRTNAVESGGSAGSNLEVLRRSDGGVILSASVQINRATGRVTFGDVGASAGLEFGTNGPRLMAGTGSPEGVVSAPVGSLWLRTDGGASTTLYVKQSGAGATGWAAK